MAAKHKLRRRLRAMAAAMGARQPAVLGDALLLLLEGAFVSSQLFGGDGPGAVLPRAAEQLIDAALAGRRKARSAS